MKLKIKKKPVKLSELKVGSLFMTPDMECLALKSEYRTDKGAIEAFIVGSGEMFWGGTSDIRVQLNLDVLEVEIIGEPKKPKKAHIRVVSTALDDHGQYGTTEYKCSECGHDCKGHVKKCPKCGVKFNEPSTFEGGGYPFGGSDFI